MNDRTQPEISQCHKDGRQRQGKKTPPSFSALFLKAPARARREEKRAFPYIPQPRRGHCLLGQCIIPLSQSLSLGQIGKYCLYRATYYFRRATTPTVEDWNSTPLPDFLFPLYHLVRPLRLMSHYRLKLWKWFYR